jgi:hypothetical protein
MTMHRKSPAISGRIDIDNQQPVFENPAGYLLPGLRPLRALRVM